jgi:3'-phosphoadenosine 5'-phosphosulfate sulfotransferase (PAPS reductase)/FAD synthetase
MKNLSIEQAKEKYAKSVEEAAYNSSVFRMKQSLPYEEKIAHAKKRAWEFFDTIHGDYNANCHVSVGGLDSITLLLFLRAIGINVPAISVSSLEDLSIQKIHKKIGVIPVKPLKSKVSVIREFGFPVISKEKANKIETLQNPTEKNKTVRHAIITGETGAQGGWRKTSKMKLPQKWLELFGGYENENEGTNYKIAPFKVSAKCCYYLKEKPCDDWAKENNSYPYLGLMASEGGRREKALAIHGCNYYGKTTIRSAPFAIFNRQDILQLAIDLKVPVPEIYGTIERDRNGLLYTTKAQRTGCTMCGFGVHIEARPNRFDRLRETNPKEWEFWMFNCCIDENGEKYGWARVLDYIGVGWQKEIEQLSLFDGGAE